MNEPGGPWCAWLEIKGPKTKVSPDQIAWGQRCMAAGVPWFVVRHPDDLAGVFECLGFQRPLQDGTNRLRVGGTYTAERDVQRDVKAILDLYGWDITDTSQGYRPGGKRHATTRITKGTPDLWVTHPPARRGLTDPKNAAL